MRPLSCRCGQPVFFDNQRCSACGRLLAFDPSALVMQSEQDPGFGMPVCQNRSSAIRCNWLAADGGVCLSCRMSRIIPALSKPANRERWRKLEQAKRHLLYDLLSAGLPVDPAHLAFEFKEDRRTNPFVADEHVSIGHSQGVITVNVAEADEVYREQMRQLMNESNRSLLGHLRHESGHYYFNVLIGAEQRDEVRRLFGDESSDYAASLANYYANGPDPNWRDRFISAYASSHPAEDWAECWAHYLHIRAALETANGAGLRGGLSIDQWQVDFVNLMVAVNELLRSLGLTDAYPYVITPPIAEKISYIHTRVQSLSDQPAAPGLAAG